MECIAKPRAYPYPALGGWVARVSVQGRKRDLHVGYFTTETDAYTHASNVAEHINAGGQWETEREWRLRNKQTGTTRLGNVWVAQIAIPKTREIFNLGRFDTQEEAHKAYLNARAVLESGGTLQRPNNRRRRKPDPERGVYLHASGKYMTYLRIKGVLSWKYFATEAEAREWRRAMIVADENK